MAAVDPCDELKWVDELLEWWMANKAGICRSPDAVKKHRDLARQIEDSRRKECNLRTVRYHLAQIIYSIDELRQINHDLTAKLKPLKDDFCKRWADTERELNRFVSAAGFATQALVTKWFQEAGFRIADIEVAYEDGRGKHSFDIEIEHENGTYDVEVWQCTGPLVHKEQLDRMRFAGYGGRILCEDMGALDEGERYMSNHGGVGNDANLATLMKKVGQLREDRAGVVVALIPYGVQLHPLLVPPEWGAHLPKDKYVIVLQFGDGGWTEERRGTGYLVRPPESNRVEVVRDMIRSLRFEYIRPYAW